jgi:hypothetical protein
MELAAHLLRIECRTAAPLALPAFTGSALRGALLGALRGSFCPDGGRADCAPCPLAGVCPISRLIATVDAENARGEEAPRPYVLRPVEAAGRLLGAGEPFRFGVTLIGDAATAFPYLLQGLLAMGEAGFGLRQRAAGTFTVEQVIACNPYIAAEQTAYLRGRATVYAPALPVSAAQVSAYAAGLPGDRLSLELRSPLRLVADGALVRRLTMTVLMRRLLRRLSDLSRLFGAAPLQADFGALLQTAAAVRLVDDRSSWLDLESHSGRSGRRTPIGGLVGRVTYEGPLAPLLPYLAWLPAIGAGKDVTKGNGWIEIVPPLIPGPSPAEGEEGKGSLPTPPL